MNTITSCIAFIACSKCSEVKHKDIIYLCVECRIPLCLSCARQLYGKYYCKTCYKLEIKKEMNQ